MKGTEPRTEFTAVIRQDQRAVDGKVHMHDLHATILHQLGLNHEKLTFKYVGRDFRLTDVHGRVVKEVVG